jgi:uncharacterized protein (TIGR02145 family)
VPVIDEIVYVTDSIFVPPLGTWYVFSYAVDTLYTYVCPVQGCTDTQASNFNPLAVIEDGSCTYGPAQCGGQSTVTFDGFTYNLVGIGSQCWFKENLRSDHYRNGDSIPGDFSEAQWSSTTSGAMAVYNNDAANLATYGRLYNWYATQDSRGLCPAGFHVPSDDEWYTLEHFLGGSSVAGTAMKTSPTDTPSWDGSNTSGFSGLPAGFRSYGGDCYDLGRLGYLWSTFPTGGVAIFRSLYAEETHVYRSSSYLPQNGFSVRCVRD